jgi:hypothetical protein
VAARGRRPRGHALGALHALGACSSEVGHAPVTQLAAAVSLRRCRRLVPLRVRFAGPPPSLDFCWPAAPFFIVLPCTLAVYSGPSGPEGPATGCGQPAAGCCDSPGDGHGHAIRVAPSGFPATQAPVIRTLIPGRSESASAAPSRDGAGRARSRARRAVTPSCSPERGPRRLGGAGGGRASWQPRSWHWRGPGGRGGCRGLRPVRSAGGPSPGPVLTQSCPDGGRPRALAGGCSTPPAAGAATIAEAAAPATWRHCQAGVGCRG